MIIFLSVVIAIILTAAIVIFLTMKATRKSYFHDFKESRQKLLDKKFEKDNDLPRGVM
jgi:archaellum component FlaF (FlaF/FlaG flagellin family)